MGVYTVPLTAVTTSILPGGNDSGPFYLTNSGSVPVYVDSAPQPNPTDGTLINIGASLEWRKGEALYAKVASGTGSLNVSNSSTNIFDPASIASRINAVGVPTIDQPTTVISVIQNVASGATPTSSNITDVSKFQTVFINISENGATNNTNVRSYKLSWYADSGGLLLLDQNDFDVASYGGIAQLTRPVKAAYLQITASSVVSTTVNAVSWSVIASYRLQSSKTILKSTKNNASGTIQTGSDVYKGIIRTSVSLNNASIQEYIDIQTGKCTFYYRTTSSPAGTFAFDFFDFAGNAFFAQAFATGAPSGGAISLNLPPQPFSFFVINTVASLYTADFSWVADPL